MNRSWTRAVCLLAVTAALVPLAAEGVAGAATLPAGSDAKVLPGGTCPVDAATMAQNASNAAGSSFVTNDVVNDKHSMFNSVDAINADAYYHAGYYGQGVDVALIDTGVAPVDGLNNGNVVQGPDLSFESQSPYAHSDTYGHGTHLASLINGRDDTSSANNSSHKPYGWNDPSKFTGVAPGARLVSLKIGDSQGAVDVTQMIAAIDWVVKHAKDAPSSTNPKGFNIRVLNLSFGLNAGLFDTAQTDALSFAVEQAWSAGIVVVAAAGNSGKRVQKTDPPLASPAFNNDIMAVGAYDPATNTVAGFSQGGTTARLPDFVAPGQSVLGLHVTGSSADDEILADCAAAVAQGAPWTYPVVGPDGRFVHGSGTSQAAAIVSGASALMLSKQPSLSNNDIKSILRRSANPSVGGTTGSYVKGKGLVDLANAYSKDAAGTTSVAVTGGASLDAARGGAFLTDGVSTLQGNIDIFGNPVDVPALQAAETKGTAWTKNPDGTESWFTQGFVLDSAFVPDSTFGTVWSGARWSGRRWSEQSWTGRRWSDQSWTGRRWSGNRWSGSQWSGQSWTGRRWSGIAWRDNAWS